MNTLRHLHWPLIMGLGALALVRPVLSMVGLLRAIGQPFGTIGVTALISLVWLLVVVVSRVRAPVLTLVLAGVTYGVLAIVLGTLLPAVLNSEQAFPITNPFAIVAVLITNAIWGGCVGLVALAMQPLMARRA